MRTSGKVIALATGNYGPKTVTVELEDAGINPWHVGDRVHVTGDASPTLYRDLRSAKFILTELLRHQSEELGSNVESVSAAWNIINDLLDEHDRDAP